MAVHITLEDVINELPKIIEQEGKNFIYRKPEGFHFCVNVLDGKGSCLIGRYLISKGVPVNFFYGSVGSESYQEAGISYLSRDSAFREYVLLDDAALYVLAQIQDDQDCSMPWGRAYTKATGIAL